MLLLALLLALMLPLPRRRPLQPLLCQRCLVDRKLLSIWVVELLPLFWLADVVVEKMLAEVVFEEDICAFCLRQRLRLRLRLDGGQASWRAAMTAPLSVVGAARCLPPAMARGGMQRRPSEARATRRAQQEAQ